MRCAGATIWDNAIMSTMPKSDAEYTDTREREIQVRRVAAASLVGTTIEWYDFLVYATIAGVIFNRYFFAEKSIFVNTLSPTGHLRRFFYAPARRIAVWLFRRPHRPKTSACPCPGDQGHCHLSDRPFATYQQIGVAPVLLVTLRLVQGTALGGEWGGAVLMAYEFARPDAPQG